MADAAQFWLDSCGRQPLLTAAEEVHLGALVRAWQDWDPTPADAPPAIKRRGLRARDRFVSGNLRLVAHVTRVMRPGLGIAVSDSDMPDLLQAGAIGLMRGAERFDPARGYKFSTFAYWWIRQGLARWADSSSRTIRLPTTHGPKLARLGRVGAQLTAELGRQPTRVEIADALGMRLADLDLVLRVGLPCWSLDQAHGDLDNPSSLSELLAAPAPEEPGPDVVELHRRLAGLDPLSRRLVIGRWGLEQPVQPVLALAQAEGIPAARVRSLLAAAEQQLRDQPTPPPLTPWRPEVFCQLSLLDPTPTATP